MGNDPRWVPPGRLVEVTLKAIHGRYLLRPSRDLVDIFNGVLMRAAERYPVKVCAFVCLSNHLHMLLVPEDCKALSAFMNYFGGNLGKEVGRLHDWRRIFGRRYSHSLVGEAPEDQESRLRYLLSNGCKEGLVKRPEDWPGPSSTEALLTGRPVRGIWFDRSSEYEARRCNRSCTKYEFTEVHERELDPLPAWKELSPEERQARVQAMVREITAETRARIEETGRPVLGVKRLLRQHPHERPARTKKTPKPIVHSASRRVREAMRREFYVFRRAYRAASEALRAGDLEVEFPPGCHRPRLPYFAGRPPPEPASAA